MRHSYLSVVAALMLGAIFPGCGASMHKAHEPDLLDNKVLLRRVQAALDRASSDFQNVQITVADGTVLLAGSVDSQAARSRAGDIARTVYGVKEVKNQINVVPGSQ